MSILVHIGASGDTPAGMALPAREPRPRTLSERICTLGGAILPGLLRRMGVPPSDRDDLEQDALIVAHGAQSRFTPPAPDATDAEWEQALGGWLVVIARNLVRNHRRRSLFRRRFMVSADGDLFPREPIDTAPTSEQSAEEEQRWELLERLLAKLEPERREVLTLFALEGLTYTEIMHTLGMSRITVQSRLRQARTDLRAAVKRLRDEEQVLLGIEAPERRGRRALAGLGISGALADLQRRIRAAFARTLGEARRLVSAALGGGAIAIVAAVIATSVGVYTCARPRVPSAVSIVGVQEHVVPPETAALVSAVASSPPASRTFPTSVAGGAAPPAHRARPTVREALDREVVLLEAARRALKEGASARASARLAMHAEQFPEGALAAERERLHVRLQARRERVSP